MVALAASDTTTPMMASTIISSINVKPGRKPAARDVECFGDVMIGLPRLAAGTERRFGEVTLVIDPCLWRGGEKGVGLSPICFGTDRAGRTRTCRAFTQIPPSA